MILAALVLSLLVALIHVYIFVLEAVLWTKPKGLKTFRMDAAKAETTRVLALNQGFYNLFLAFGILFGLSLDFVMPWGGSVAVFNPVAALVTGPFLFGVAAMGVVGGLTVSKSILYVQTVPAVLALAALLACWR